MTKSKEITLPEHPTCDNNNIVLRSVNQFCITTPCISSLGEQTFCTATKTVSPRPNLFFGDQPFTQRPIPLHCYETLLSQPKTRAQRPTFPSGDQSFLPSTKPFCTAIKACKSNVILPNFSFWRPKSLYNEQSSCHSDQTFC